MRHGDGFSLNVALPRYQFQWGVSPSPYSVPWVGGLPSRDRRASRLSLDGRSYAVKVRPAGDFSRGSDWLLWLFLRPTIFSLGGIACCLSLPFSFAIYAVVAILWRVVLVVNGTRAHVCVWTHDREGCRLYARSMRFSLLTARAFREELDRAIVRAELAEECPARADAGFDEDEI